MTKAYWVNVYIFEKYSSSTVANFSPEHSGTEKGQRGYPLCLKSEIFIFIMKSFGCMKKVYSKEYLSVDLAALINLVLFATKFLNSLQVME